MTPPRPADALVPVTVLTRDGIARSRPRSAAATRRTAAEQIGELSEQVHLPLPLPEPVRALSGRVIHRMLCFLRRWRSLFAPEALLLGVTDEPPPWPWQIEGGSPNLLARVRRLLRHKNWETRVAASHAVDAICKRMPVWEPDTCVKTEDGDTAKTADPLLVQGLPKLDIKGVIERGQTLVSSTGTEFDDVTDSIADPKERLAAKKQQLRAALGLDAAAGGKGDGMAQVAAKRGDGDLFNMKDLVKDEDVEMQSAPQAKPGASAANKRKASDIIDSMQGAADTADGAGEDESLAHLSARERNQLRRKQRKMQRDGKGGGGGGGGGAAAAVRWRANPL